MNEGLVHDIGGDLGYGPILHDPEEPVFHYEWERRVFGVLFQVLRITAQRPGEMRYAIERLAEDDYFKHGGYFGRWEAVSELLLEEYGYLEKGELDQVLGALEGTGPASRARPIEKKNLNLLPDDVGVKIPGARTVRRELPNLPRFEVGELVLAPETHQKGHTRLPAYVAGKQGRIVAIHPAEVLPDSSAHGLGERPQHVYCVGFDGEVLWGSQSEKSIKIHVDLYENYLSRVKKN
ncbi:MAG: nitrile hydratase subunit beta [Actinobacteria bacterium]|jgi:nitrile hydratase subunit beta|nr:nitrile hydratase subunit beta [Actinomycetota bacterium]